MVFNTRLDAILKWFDWFMLIDCSFEFLSKNQGIQQKIQSNAQWKGNFVSHFSIHSVDTSRIIIHKIVWKSQLIYLITQHSLKPVFMMIQQFEFLMFLGCLAQFCKCLAILWVSALLMASSNSFHEAPVSLKKCSFASPFPSSYK